MMQKALLHWQSLPSPNWLKAADIFGGIKVNFRVEACPGINLLPVECCIVYNDRNNLKKSIDKACLL